jgi:hypothetical protein
MPNRRSPEKLVKKLQYPEQDLDKFVLRNPEYKLRKWITANKYSDSLNRFVVQVVGHCVLCGFNNKEALEIHHIDGNHNNNSWNNIPVICANCHTLITKGKLNYWEELNRNKSKIENANLTMTDSSLSHSTRRWQK